jgi:hypothetical protein
MVLYLTSHDRLRFGNFLATCHAACSSNRSRPGFKIWFNHAAKLRLRGTV